MEKRVRDFKVWIRNHKKELIIAGVSITAVLAAIVVIRHRNELEALWKVCKGKIAKDNVRQVSTLAKNPARASIPATASCTASVKNPIQEVVRVIPTEVSVPTQSLTTEAVPIARATPAMPFEVNSHFRHLPSGQNPSAMKIAQAMEQGIELPPRCTLVDSYVKYASAS